jgi:hypothetical protein
MDLEDVKKPAPARKPAKEHAFVLGLKLSDTRVL